MTLHYSGTVGPLNFTPHIATVTLPSRRKQLGGNSLMRCTWWDNRHCCTPPPPSPLSPLFLPAPIYILITPTVFLFYCIVDSTVVRRLRFGLSVYLHSLKYFPSPSLYNSELPTVLKMVKVPLLHFLLSFGFTSIQKAVLLKYITNTQR